MLQRIGKWTTEEEVYAEYLIAQFKRGLLEDGDRCSASTTVRNYVAAKLMCDPLRVTKKYSRKPEGFTGPVHYRAGEDSSPVEAEERRLRYTHLRKQFLQSMCTQRAPLRSHEGNVFTALSAEDQDLFTTGNTSGTTGGGLWFPTFRGFIGTLTGRSQSNATVKKRSADESDLSDGEDISPCTYCSSESSISIQPQTADAARRNRAKQAHDSHPPIDDDDCSTSYLDTEFTRQHVDYIDKDPPAEGHGHVEIDLRIAQLVADEEGGEPIEFDPHAVVHC